ncbi:MAG: germination protein Ger(x)C family [Pelosinus sp.]|nr:germination protein Ger(x)C family [Pelosinus sp.]
MYLRLVVGTILLGIGMLLSGCNGARESEEVAYIVAIGIDKAEQEGIIKVTYQIAKPNVEGSKGEGEKDTVLITNSAVSIAESLNLLNSTTSLTPSMSHVKVLVVGQELARRGLADMWGSLKRYREYRGSMFVLVARGTARDFLEANKPSFNISASKYFETMLDSGVETGYYLRTSFHQFYIRLKSNSAQSYATLVDISTLSGKGEIATPKVPGGKIDGYVAGDIPLQGGNPIEFAGTAIFNGDKMVGILSTTETRMLAMLLGDYTHGFLTVEDPLDPKYFLNVLMRLGSAPKIKVTLEDGHPVIHVKMLLEGEITNLPSGINYEQTPYLNLLEKQVNTVLQQEMLNMIQHTQELKSDVAGFGYYLRPSFTNYQEYLKYPWHEQYGQAIVNVTINTKVRRTGLMIRTYPVK